MTRDVVRGGVDTWVWGATGKTRKNFRKGNYLQAMSNSGGAGREILLRLKSPVARKATVMSAQLVLRQAVDVASSAITLTVQRTTTNPNFETVTWARKPASAGPIASLTKTGPPAGTVWAFDVTEIVQAIADGAPGNAFRITSSSTNAIQFWSMNSSRTGPYLEVVWSTKPEAPTRLKPAYGAVASAKPIVQCDYTDHSGSTDLIAMQVQIDPDNDFGSPAWDSGTVPVSEPQLNLAATSYPGLAAGSFTYWRCRVRDGDGLWSDWSDSVQMIRYAKGVVTIVSPGADPNDFVSEFTPPILWTFSEDQTHFRVVVTPAGNPKRILHDSGKIQDTDESYTIPKRVLKDDSRYIVTVQCWDNVDREATSGEPVYAQASREFSVDYDPTIDPPSTLVATQPSLGVSGVKPWVDLVFMRATAPDTWTIVRDGVAIDTDVEPGDLLEVDEDGVTYRYRDFTARPEVRHDYQVRAEVNGKLSPPRTTTITPKCMGIWLVDPTRTGQQIILASRTAVSSSQDDLADTYSVMGSVGVVRSVMGLTGLSGAVTDGMLFSRRGGPRWEQMEAALLDFKGRPADEFRMVWGDLNIPVVLGNVHIAPHPETLTGRVMKSVSYAWWQVDEFPFDTEL